MIKKLLLVVAAFCLLIPVVACGPTAELKITTSSLPDAIASANYQVALEATGGSGKYDWSIVSGTLPEGLGFEGGVISGAASSDAISSLLKIEVSDGQTTATKDLSLYVFKESGTVPIGCVLSTTGLLGAMGERMMQGARMAVEEINVQGGVLGKRVKLIEENDNTEAAKCLERVKKVVEINGVKVLVGGMTSGATMASGSYVADHEILMVSPSATNPGIADQDWTDWVYRTCLNDAFQAKALAPIVVEGNYTKLATVVQDNPYGVGLEEAMLDALNDVGWQGEHVSSIHFDPAKSDYRTELQQIAGANPDVVFAVTYCDDGKILFKQALEMGLDTIAWLGCDGNYGSGMFEEPKCAEFMEKALVAGTRTAGATGAVHDQFVEEYIAEFGEAPEVYCDTTYDAVKLIARAIEDAGVYDSAAIREALMAIGQNYEGASGTISFNDKGDRVSGTFEIWKVEKDEEGVYHDVPIKFVTVS